MKHHPIAEAFPLMSKPQLAELADSIKRNGLRRAIAIYDGMIIDGRNRFAACQVAGVEPRFEQCFDENLFAFVRDHNAQRRDLEPGQRVLCLLRLKEAENAWIAERKARQARKGEGAGRPKKSGGNVAPRKPREDHEACKERAALAREAGCSPRTAQKAITVRKKAPELAAQVVSGEVSLQQAYRSIEKAEAVAKISAEPAPLPAGPFRVFVADPPWAYTKRTEDGTHRGERPYPDMPTSQICALPIGELAHDDAILWLWTTNAFMRDAFDVARAWGFGVKTILTWAKDRMGTGDWLRGKTEHCLLAVRGRPTVNLTNQTTLLVAKVREHSRKPDEFYRLVEQLCPGSKVDIFAREQRKGWATWGAEQEKFA